MRLACTLVAFHLDAPASPMASSELGVGAERTWPVSGQSSPGARLCLLWAPRQWVPGELSGVSIAAGNTHFVSSWVPIDWHPVSEAAGWEPQGNWGSVARGEAGNCQTSACSSVLPRHNKDLVWRTLKPLVCQSSRVLDRLCYSSQVSNGPCYSP